MSPVSELDELRLLVVVDNETDTLSSVDEGVPQIPEAMHLAGRTASVREIEGVPSKVLFDRLCCAGHGFSVLVTGRKGDETHTMLFDVGPYGDLWKDNAARLDIDLAAIEVIFLSHWHFDHSGALPAVVEVVANARRQAGAEAPLVVDLHPDRPEQRGIKHPLGMFLMLAPEPRFEDIEAAGGRVATHGEAHAICNGFFLGSGEIPRVTDYETGLVGHHTFTEDKAIPDPLILDERYLAAHVRGRGVTVLSACSHAGVVNAALAAKQAFAGAPIDTVLGGYHLSGNAMEERIPATVRDLGARIDPRVVAPGHCTGWRAKAALADAFAPGRYGPSVVGSLYVLSAE